MVDMYSTNIFVYLCLLALRLCAMVCMLVYQLLPYAILTYMCVCVFLSSLLRTVLFHLSDSDIFMLL